jgi:hypothetical protein
MLDELKTYFSAQNLTRSIAVLDTVKTPILDKIFKQDTSNILPTIAYEVYEQAPGVLPGVAPGAAAVNVRTGAKSTFYVKEGIDIRVQDSITAHELNMYKLVGFKGLQQKIDQKLSLLKDSIKRTREVLAAKALTGTITHAVVTEAGGVATYEVTFGNPLEHTPDVLWTAEGANPYADLRAMARAIEEETGYPDAFTVLIGYQAMDALLSYLFAQHGALVASLVTVQDYGRGLTFGGFTFIEVVTKYVDVDGSEAYAIPPDKVCLVAQSAPFIEYFSAIDDLEAGLQPVPIFAKSWEEKDPSRQVLLAHSKPLPVVHVPSAICWAKVV